MVVDVGGTGGVVNIVDGGGGTASSAELQKMLESESEKKKLARMGMLTALAIGIHNFPEGLATFMATLADPTVGAALAVAIAIHNIPEGLCVSIPENRRFRRCSGKRDAEPLAVAWRMFYHSCIIPHVMADVHAA